MADKQNQSGFQDDTSEVTTETMDKTSMENQAADDSGVEFVPDVDDSNTSMEMDSESNSSIDTDETI